MAQAMSSRAMRSIRVNPVATDKFRHGRQDDIRLGHEKTGLDIIMDTLGQIVRHGDR